MLKGADAAVVAVYVSVAVSMYVTVDMFVFVQSVTKWSNSCGNPATSPVHSLYKHSQASHGSRSVQILPMGFSPSSTGIALVAQCSNFA